MFAANFKTTFGKMI